MSLTLATNIASINTQKWLGVSGAGQSKALEQLSSGSKINKAADDAAGSAISTKLNVKSASITKAIDNGNQAIAMLQTAESGMSTVADILTRLKELATEAASDNNATDRSQLQSERVQLEIQINNIAGNTKYGATSLLNGTNAVSTGTQGAALVSANGINSITGTTTGEFAITAAAVAGSTTQMDLTVSSLTGGNTQTVRYTIPTGGTTDVKFSSFGLTVNVNNLVDPANLVGVAGGTTTTGTNYASFGKMAGTLKFTDSAAGAVTNIDLSGVNSIDSLVSAINAKVATTGVTAAVSGTGTLSLVKAAGSNVAVDVSGITTGDIGQSVAQSAGFTLTGGAAATVMGSMSTFGKMEGTLKINGTAIDVSDVANTTQLAAAINSAAITNVTAAVNASGHLTLTNGAGASDVVVDESGLTSGSVGFTTANKQNAAGNAFAVVSTGEDTAFSYQLGDTSSSYNQVSVTIGGVSLNALGLSVTVNSTLLTWSNDDAGKAAAQAYLDTLSGGTAGTDNTGVNYVNNMKSLIGAAQNQINYQISNLENTLQNTESASSTIKDTDYAASMSEFTKYQVMTQAGVAMLAQSNQLPQQILTLLRG